MEKFGIFELLDTLSAFMTASAPQGEAPIEPAEKPQVAETVSPSRGDSAYQPPQYGTDEQNSAQAALGGRDALGSFLERHDAISKKIDGKK